MASLILRRKNGIWSLLSQFFNEDSAAVICVLPKLNPSLDD